ncbi:hypothetical protein ACFUV1_33985 [Streptomyces griseoincarnatus]|uniref:hypothetical protein n=1 Tax=Streptomyces sp. TRM75561 TaxID=2975269 RepID=UPI00244A2C15|nr:hypothetical protein [Streptomyces sp. TRM75561]MDH3037386.1 hypothetical protein [Streptomyces sp. TRM75561]
MPDRSLRLLTFPQQSAQGGERGAVLLRERPSSPPDASRGDGDDRRDGQGQDSRDGRGSGQDDNPFAPPPEGTPDRPWQPRHPSGGDGEGGGRSPWGRNWSDRQPGRSSGGFGERPRGPEGQGGGQQGQGGGQQGQGMRWDPTDPAQRRARYALLGGMWAFFFALFNWPYLALLLGALALYWSISALRAKPRGQDPDAPASEQKGRPQTTAAVSGLVTAGLALLLVAGVFGARLVYSDYYECTSDALTQQARQSCGDHLPEQLRGLLDEEG